MITYKGYPIRRDDLDGKLYWHTADERFGPFEHYSDAEADIDARCPDVDPRAEESLP
jgi:hypothetical protein